MASYFNRLKQAWSVITGKKDVAKLEQEVQKAHKQVSDMEQEVQEARETVAANDAKMKKQARYYTDRSIATDSEIKGMGDKLRSMARRAVPRPKGSNSTEALSDMTDIVLLYEGDRKDPKPALVPDVVEELIFRGKADLSSHSWRRKFEGKPLYMRLAMACFRNANESWAKPVLTSLFQALPRKEQEEIIMGADYWRSNHTVAHIKLWDHAISMVPSKEFDLTHLVINPHVYDSATKRYALAEDRNISAWLMILLKKNGVLTTENPSYKKIVDSIPLYKAKDEESIKARPWNNRYRGSYVPDILRWVSNCDGDIEKWEERNRKASQLEHDKIMAAKTPRDRKNADDRFGDVVREQSAIYHALTGKILWPDWQKTQPVPGKKHTPDR